MAEVEKAPTDYASTDGATWAWPLAQSGLLSDFLPLLHGETILGRLAPVARRAPFMAPTPKTSALPAASWTAEGAPKAISAGALDMLDPLQRRKVSSIMVYSRELARVGAAAEPVQARLQLDTLPEDVTAIRIVSATNAVQAFLSSP